MKRLFALFTLPCLSAVITYEDGGSNDSFVTRYDYFMRNKR